MHNAFDKEVRQEHAISAPKQGYVPGVTPFRPDFAGSFGRGDTVKLRQIRHLMVDGKHEILFSDAVRPSEARNMTKSLGRGRDAKNTYRGW